MDESVARVVPAEFKTGGERRDPDLADRRVGRNHELGFLGFLEKNFELSRFPFDVETVLIACREHAALEVLEGGIRLSLKIFFVEHLFSVHEVSPRWVEAEDEQNDR